jgi:hypothetical protein
LIIFLPISLIFLLAVTRGSLVGWWFFPVVTVVLPIVAKFIILGFILLYSLSRALKLFSYTILGIYLGEFKVGLISFLGLMWWIGKISLNSWVALMRFGGYLLKFLDQGWLENYGPQGVYLKLSHSYSLVDQLSYQVMKKILFIMYIIFLITLFLVVLY